MKQSLFEQRDPAGGRIHRKVLRLPLGLSAHPTFCWTFGMIFPNFFPARPRVRPSWMLGRVYVCGAGAQAAGVGRAYSPIHAQKETAK